KNPLSATNRTANLLIAADPVLRFKLLDASECAAEAASSRGHPSSLEISTPKHSRDPRQGWLLQVSVPVAAGRSGKQAPCRPCLAYYLRQPASTPGVDQSLGGTKKCDEQ